MQGAHWIRRAADQGHEESQTLLGKAYYNGEGVPKDDVQAFRWLRLAAEQGESEAQQALGFMYFYGEGIPEDHVNAYAWLSVAVAQGQESAKKLKEYIAKDMAKSQIARAQQLSNEYWERYGVPHRDSAQ